MLIENRFDTMDGAGPMHKSDAVGRQLLHDDGKFGADLIEFPPFGSVPLHTHPGAHMLFCLAGSGLVIREEKSLRLSPGICYFVAAGQPHEVLAESAGLRLLVVGDDVRPVCSKDRLDLCS